MTQTNKLIIAKYIDDNKAGIIQKYAKDMPISEIAEIYGVATTTIYLRLVKWGVKIKKYVGPRRTRKERPVGKFKLKKSPELIAQQEINSQVNKKYIKPCKFVHTSEDQKLIANMLYRI